MIGIKKSDETKIPKANDPICSIKFKGGAR
jgi:hypothetical protein